MISIQHNCIFFIVLKVTQKPLTFEMDLWGVRSNIGWKPKAKLETIRIINMTKKEELIITIKE